jgi:hypothetical protein
LTALPQFGRNMRLIWALQNTEKQFSMFKDKIESDIAVVINKLSEQTRIINNKSKQDICKLSDENLNSKSRLAELE